MLAEQELLISKIGQDWHIIVNIYLPLGITISSVIDCTDGVEFDYSLYYMRIFRQNYLFESLY